MQFILGLIVGVIGTLIVQWFSDDPEPASQTAATFAPMWVINASAVGGSFIVALGLTAMFARLSGSEGFTGEFGGVVIAFLALWLAGFIALSWALG